MRLLTQALVIAGMTNESSGTIGRANLDGTGVSQSFITGASHPEGLAVVPVPEPATGLLVMGGVLGLAVTRRRRRLLLVASLLFIAARPTSAGALAVNIFNNGLDAMAMMIATGIYWVATIERQHRQGYGEALSWAAAGGGRELGCTIARRTR
ncbi:MAG TPA: PEP-CTERM sorting domain-containing protein [Myxococcota bacterium]|nr:PEP-CTERM sorting domain-containing protein [Myxococcota bacterium]